MLKKIGCILFAPAKGINSLARKMGNSETLEIFIISIISFIVIVAIVAKCWPIHNGWEFLFLMIITLVALCVAVGISSSLLSAFAVFLIWMTDGMANLYDKCTLTTQTTFSPNSIRNNQKAEVTLQYFISHEKMDICHAKYLGKQ